MLALNIQKLHAFVPWHVTSLCEFILLSHMCGGGENYFSFRVLSTGELMFAVGKQHLGQG